MPDVDLLHSPCQSATKQHPLALESPFPLALHNRLFRSCFSPPHPTRLWQRPCSPGRCIFPPIPCPSIPFPQCGIPSSSHSPNPKPLLCTNQAHRLERRRMAWGGGHPVLQTPFPPSHCSWPPHSALQELSAAQQRRLVWISGV